MDKLLWTPDLYGTCDFGIHLNRDFAREMILSKILPEKQKRINELASEELKRLGISWISPYAFHQDSGFINRFYIGQDARLTANHQDIIDILQNKEPDKKTIIYNSYNVDNQSQAYALIKLFNMWIDFSDVIRGK